ncbi:AI-2E family transporter [Alienimonas californiensis]|uniref:AI-2 transport protein TqsA n=1 Tax=Alienimonas californiensis TaxID=2527989 RepID=A0A517P5L0_9PLAN|nr:AI-2E family transporter [Alienimonas californiensis]QDT14651.1 AI-2 transport protein TqsA [Alienimonas californiensis]
MTAARDDAAVLDESAAAGAGTLDEGDSPSGLADAPDEVLDELERTHDEEAFTEELLEETPRPAASAPMEASRTAEIADLELPPVVALRVSAFSLLALTLIALGAVMFLARGVFLPIAAAAVLNLLLSPLVRALKRGRIPEPIGAGIVLGAAGAALLGLAAAVLPAVQSQFAEAPEIIQKIQRQYAPELEAFYNLTAKVEKTEATADAAVDPAESAREVVERDPQAILEEEAAEEADAEEIPVDVTSSLTGELLGDDVFNAARNVLTLAFATVVLLYFLLASGDVFTRKCIELTPHFRDKRAVRVLIGDAQAAIGNYLLTVTVINAGLGVAVGSTMWLIGMPNAVLWGALAFLFNYIPYVGAVFGAAIVTLVSFGEFEGLRMFLAPALYLCWTTLEGNFITPSILGERLNLNAPVIFAWLLLLGWIWGVPGALLAVPILAAMKILCDHVDALGPVGKFLTGD